MFDSEGIESLTPPQQRKATYKEIFLSLVIFKLGIFLNKYILLPDNLTLLPLNELYNTHVYNEAYIETFNEGIS